jgi:hypothetical protein
LPSWFSGSASTYVGSLKNADEHWKHVIGTFLMVVPLVS